MLGLALPASAAETSYPMVESGVKEIVMNGEKLEGNYIPADKLKDVNDIVVTLGK